MLREHLGIALDQLLEIAVDPCATCRVGQPQNRLGVATAQRELDIAPQIGHISRQGQRVERRGCELLQERRAGGVADRLSYGQPIHRQAHDPPGPRPCFGAQLSDGAARQDEAARPTFIIDGALDRAEDLGHHLPLVKQHGLALDTQRSVRVGAKRGGLGRSVEPHDGLDMAARRMIPFWTILQSRFGPGQSWVPPGRARTTDVGPVAEPLDRLIVRRAYGFHGANAALALVQLTCGPVTLTLPHERSFA